ncbi:MAG: gamma-glutamyltransferase [Gemmatimonadales bacterium]|nr:MAG: gamma-glutamyltransferase [Gemmatimonadales bacterium]
MRCSSRHIPSLLAMVTLAVGCAPPDPLPHRNTTAVSEVTPLPVAGRSTVYAPSGMVATSQPLASAAALEILRQGGNAFDAAVAASAVLSLVEPHMTGLGGDLFALFWSSREGRLVGLDASGRAGARMTPERIRADGFEGVPYQGPGSVTVPGAVAGWEALLDRYGSFPLPRVLQPAIQLAEDGFPVSPIIARQWAAEEHLLLQDPGATDTYLVEGERAPRAGEWFRNPDLATSLRQIADQGAAAMYGGPLGRRIVEGLEPMGGYLTLDDMQAMEPEWVTPISTDYKGWTVWEMPPAVQGIAALQMLEILEPFDLQAMGHNSPEYLHHLIEAKKIAFADLAYVADREYLEFPVTELLDPGYLATRRDLLDPSRAAERQEPGAFATSTETIYLAIADGEGNMVSFIHSIYEYFGSGIVIPGTGFVLQNRGAGFTMDAGSPNQVSPGKRPFHTLIPGFVTRNGEPLLAFGVMGGSMQPQGHVQVVLNMVEFGMDPQQAIDAARFRHRGGLQVAIENATPGLVARLEAMGHDVTPWENVAFGGGQMVMKLDQGWAGASDARKDGLAIGH